MGQKTEQEDKTNAKGKTDEKDKTNTKGKTNEKDKTNAKDKTDPKDKTDKKDKTNNVNEIDKTDNRLESCSIEEYVGGNQTINHFYTPQEGEGHIAITLLQDKERQFVVTHNANIRSVPYFTGRETELRELRQRVEEGRKSVLVSGMGGIGKTHICRKLFEEYLERHDKGERVPFRHIGYIEYDGDMGSSLQGCLRFKRQNSPEQDREAAWRELEYLAADGKLLLFVDNVNVPVGQDAGLERLRSIPGAIVLTSRRASLGKEFEPHRIGFLSTGQCVEVYERILYGDGGRRVPEEEMPDLIYIIEHMAAWHTITVEFLGHLASAKGWNVKRLRDELESKGFQLEYEDEEDRLVNIQKSYEALYDLSGLTGAEENILEAFSVFPYIPLGAETCKQWLLEDAGACEDEDILMRLYKKGWLQFDREQDSFALHPVFAQFICDKNKPNAGRHSGLLEACKGSLEIPESGSALECREFIPFAEHMMKMLDMEEDIEQSDFIFTFAYLLYYIAEYKKAEELYERSLRICKKMLGEEHSYTVTVYNNLAGVYKSQGEYQKAKKLYEKSLRISEKVLGEEHPDTATSYNNLAGVYESRGAYQKAEKLYEKSLRIREKVLGEEHPSTATSYNNLAGVYESQGEYQKAKELYEKSLRIREKVLGEEHPDTAASYNNLAGVYESQGEYHKAEGLYEKSLRIREKVLGEEHPSTATSYNNLAGVYKSQGKYQKAEELYKKSLRIGEKVFGEEHPSTAKSYNNLAGVYRHQGECQKAEELYKKSLRISEKVLGEEHPFTAASYNNLAGVYKSQGEYQKAEGLYEKSLRINKKVLGEGHPFTAASYNNLAGLYKSQRKYQKAEELYEKSLRIRERVLGEEHPSTVTSYNNLAVVYESQGEYRKAEGLYEKGLRISEKVFGEEHPSTATSYNNLAVVYFKREEYERALTYCFRAYRIYVIKCGINHPQTQIAYKNLKTIYSHWNPKGDFQQWLDERMEE